MLRKIIFFVFDCLLKNFKENQIEIKLIINLSILKLFNMSLNK